MLISIQKVRKVGYEMQSNRYIPRKLSRFETSKLIESPIRNFESLKLTFSLLVNKL